VADNFASAPERFTAGLPVLLVSPDGSERRANVERVALQGKDLVMKFEGVDDRNSAEGLRDHEVRIPLEERPPAPEGEYYLADLIGCRVQSIDGREIGEVTGWKDYGAAPLLEVQSGEREILVPFTDAIYREIDIAGRRIVVDLPEGLESL
jgi:16S rRNA processing protein RimM